MIKYLQGHAPGKDRNTNITSIFKTAQFDY